MRNKKQLQSYYDLYLETFVCVMSRPVYSLDVFDAIKEVPDKTFMLATMALAANDTKDGKTVRTKEDFQEQLFALAGQ